MHNNLIEEKPMEHISNKQMGNVFERELAQILYDAGFWVHLLNQNQDGQPADMIAVKNQKAYLIDCKVCATKKGFDRSRIEDNQDLAMTLWKACGNLNGWFALKLKEDIYFILHSVIKTFRSSQRTLSPEDIRACGIPLKKWVELCK